MWLVTMYNVRPADVRALAACLGWAGRAGWCLLV